VPVASGDPPRPRSDRTGTEPAPADHGVKLSYLPSLDGLRAVAVMAVLIYHAEVGWLSGGYLGVEVFFVISGYLITSLLMAEHRRTGAISLRSFWGRRARRLLPALYLLLVVVSAWWLVFARDEAHQIRGDVLAALTYVTNWWLVFSKQSYFAQAGRPSPFRHLWSLAVEEQFYLLWPLIFVGVMKLVGGRRRPVLAGILAAAGLSAVLMHLLYNPAADPSRPYYGTDTRASGLLLGAALAFLLPPWRIKAKTGHRAPLVIDGVGVLAMAGLAWFFVRVNEFDPFVYQQGFVLLDLLTVVVIVVVVHPAGVVWRWLLSLKPVVWVGQRSYGIYLWHWPVFVLTRPHLDIGLTGMPLLALRMTITIGLAELSYRFLEQPVRHGAVSRWVADVRAARVESTAERIGRPGRTAATVGAVLLVVGAVAVGLTLAPTAQPKPPAGFGDSSAREAGTIPPPTSPGLRTTLPATSAPTVPPTTLPKKKVGTTLPPGSSTPSTPPASTAPPTTAPVAVAGSGITAIGDSVMLGSRFALAERMPGIYVNAAVSRQWYTAPEIANALDRAGYLRQTVVVHLGTNGAVTNGALDKLLDELGPARRVLLVNTRVDRPWEQLVNQRLAETVSSHANARLVDWYAASNGHPEYFVHDGVHLTKDGTHAYADLIAQSLR